MKDHVRRLPPPDEMFDAFMARDSRYDGIFVTAVKTTGIFCRPSCPARKPARERIEFFQSARAAMAHGYRACLRCRPLEPPGGMPAPMRELVAALEREPSRRIRDGELRERGLDPVTVRRWFQRHHGMTFHAYQRARRMADAITEMKRGESVAAAAFGSGYESLSAFQDAMRALTKRPPSRSRDVLLVHLSHLLTPLGPMLLGTAGDAVCLLEFTDRRMLETQLQRLATKLQCTFVPGSPPVADATRTELDDYFAGRRREFTVPVATPGSEFQQKVWDALRRIPYGTTRSYGEQARMIGAPDAVRAVARANGDNRIAIIIPCHRVIGADGRLTGYGGGLWRKEWLLHLERTGEAPPAQAELALT